MDKIPGGGLPRASMILLAGNLGAGKTIFSTQFLHHGATNGEKGVYVSFAETRDDYFRNMLQLGMDMEGLEKKGLLKFMDFVAMEETGMSEATSMMMDTIDKFGAKRLVVDPMTAVL